MALQGEPSTLIVQVTVGGEQKQFRHTTAFRIGRSAECEVSLQDSHVSRVHARCFPQGGEWFFEDLNSSNGTFVDGAKITRMPLHTGSTLRLGAEGLTVSFLVQEAPKPVPVPTPVAVPLPLPVPVKAPAVDASRYFGKLKEGDVAGEHTMFIRSAFAEVQGKQKRRFGGVIAGLAVLLVALAVFGVLQVRKVRQQRLVAEQMFYTMKGLDLEIAALQDSVAASSSPQAKEQLRAIADRRAQMEDSYDHFLSSMHVYSTHLSEQDRLILRVARIFGECELDMPPEFHTEVQRYIKYWQTSGRFQAALTTARQKGYVGVIASTLQKQDLPPQFFYLAMNESNFQADISGPQTPYGIPKGIWQFIPAAAIHYGLHVGPLLDERVPDGKDDRNHVGPETVAAGKYLKDLYSSDAQASGLLVMACYNMGQPRVLRMIRSMPPNPRDRNFWKVMKSHRDKIPQETYDYVFRIVAAAVIGENPRAFGFNFDNPLTAPQG